MPNIAKLLGRGSLAAMAVAAGVLAVGSTSSFAVEDGAGSAPTCTAGKVWDEAKKECVDKRAGIVDDKSLTTYAAALAREGRYTEALQTLDLVSNPNDAIALSYRGYSTRKLGRVEEGIGFYLHSIAVDPTYPGVREYLGEAYISIGRVDLAKQQLTAIEGICGTTCEPAQLLAAAIQQSI